MVPGSLPQGLRLAVALDHDKHQGTVNEQIPPQPTSICATFGDRAQLRSKGAQVREQCLALPLNIDTPTQILSNDINKNAIFVLMGDTSPSTTMTEGQI